MIKVPSPNFNSRKDGKTPSILLMHYTAAASIEQALKWLTDGAAENPVSSHYLIDVDGSVYQLVAEEKRAWHAGESFWRGERDINSASIGIEIQNLDGRTNPYPEAQMESLIWLSRDIITRHAILPENILGHSDVAPERKQDPGEKFPWRTLAESGLGRWPKKFEPCPFDDSRTEELQRDLGAFGYEITADGIYGGQTKNVVKAFQRHWRQHRVDGVADGETWGLLKAML